MLKQVLIGAAIAAITHSSFAAPVGLDGAIGAEWAGVTPVQVLYNPAAPTSNFGAPTNMSNSTAYQIFTRRDSNYLYAAVQTTGGGDAAGLLFSNLYYSLRYGPGTYGNNGSSIAFEITNDRAFNPNTGIYYNDTAADLIRFVALDNVGSPDVIEAAIDLSVFTANALGVGGFGLPAGETAAGIRLNLSQSFGYSVAGGATYGDARLGFVPLAGTVPEPGALALSSLALLALAGTRRRRT
ncbi:PEP-CTERM sorting domain-containing protein [Piscinibacter koreensis]|uniref:PEP-CTERM sorting domain-containing protein n=1 Tax=Piscinibacter koreensis TaxID=2742824 RepID=A0A7Y6NMB0_9BURK|nr:PEP-CTERM sorting domain-containing protein [Schlegelella koreensis]NUZ05821.1 PEP-CTERM sorting domain-containing protein [Schlegelella koreensis]